MALSQESNEKAVFEQAVMTHATNPGLGCTSGLTPDRVSAVIVTRGDRDIGAILERLPFQDIVVWDNSKRPEDLKVLGRFAAIKEAKNKVIYTQDDDCYVDALGLLRHYEQGVVVSNMPLARLRQYGDGVTLIGFGAIFDASLLSPLERYLEKWPRDDLFMRECDRIFTGLNRTKIVDLPFRKLEYGADPGRMGSEERHWDDLVEINYRIGRLKGDRARKRARHRGKESMKPMSLIAGAVKKSLCAVGLELKRYRDEREQLQHIWEGDEEEWATYDAAWEFTMASPNLALATIHAVYYICDHKIPGDFVGCGAWRGGDAIVLARTLLSMGETQRKIYLYDEFEGSSLRCAGSVVRGTEEEVIRNVCSTGFPRERLVVVKGSAVSTLPPTVPQSIALLLLNADWHDTVKCELEHAYPGVSDGGVVILNGYSHQYGYQAAVDEYLARLRRPVYLHRVDRYSRMFTKT